MVIKNTFQRGVTIEEHGDQVPAEDGVSVHGGVPKGGHADEFANYGNQQGIPMPGPGMVPDKEDLPTAKCSGRTKKGTACRAYAVEDSLFCVAHVE